MKKQSFKFQKMQGTGNDFVVIDNRSKQFSEEEITQLAPTLCHRNFGIGADGILLLEHPSDPETDYAMVYRNPDGSHAGMCGNGARCMALFAFSKGFKKKQQFSVHDRLYEADVLSQNRVSVQLPVLAEVEVIDDLEPDPVYEVYTGTEHLVIPVEEESLEDENSLRSRGSELRHHPRFEETNGTNVNFIKGLGEQRLTLKTYERGVEDLTLSCGTGAVASALAWHHIGQKREEQNEVEISVPGGELSVIFHYNGSNKRYENIQLTGPAYFVFEGIYHL
ncbi:MAG: diaminopimelate epimerase [Balneolaceae bacterium]|nr:diaminopimelate epimerase [Balneolaceae bacterium]